MRAAFFSGTALAALLSFPNASLAGFGGYLSNPDTPDMNSCTSNPYWTPCLDVPVGTNPYKPPFKANPRDFADFLNRYSLSWKDGKYRKFSSLGKCKFSLGAGRYLAPATYQCKEAKIEIEQPLGSYLICRFPGVGNTYAVRWHKPDGFPGDHSNWHVRHSERFGNCTPK